MPSADSPTSTASIGTVRPGSGSISGFRFHHMLRRFSRDLGLLDRLAGVEADRDATVGVMAHMVRAMRVPPPLLELSRRRKHADGTPTGTGATVWSIDDLVARHGPDRVARWQEAGMLVRHRRHERIIRLGDPTLLASAAHEAAHVVIAERAPGSPPHGKRFVAALDETATAAAAWLEECHPAVFAPDRRRSRSYRDIPENFTRIPR